MTSIVVMSEHILKCPNTLLFVQTLCQDRYELYFQALAPGQTAEKATTVKKKIVCI